MATPVDNVVGLTGNSLVDGLVQGSAWQFGSGQRNITYSLSLNDNPNGGAWTTELADALRQAFAEWANVANITFTEVGSGTVYTQSTANIAVVLSGSELQESIPGVVSIGIFPSPAFANSLLTEALETRLSYPNPEGDIVFDNYYLGFGYLGEGGVGLTLMLHEIGHALGLKHTNDGGGNGRPTFGELGIGSLDSNRYTVMSYMEAGGQLIGTTYSYGNAATPMLLDILAIQQIYGANTGYRTGDDTYQFNQGGIRTLWDAGGNDTISASSSYGNASIDLRSGNFSVIGTNELAIAYNVVIENALGGIGNDTLVGNDANNCLDGGAGNDTMSGGAGDDAYAVDASQDVVIENAANGADGIVSSIGYTLPANVENLTLAVDGNIVGSGNELDNVLVAQGTRNVLNGGDGNDTLIDAAGGYAKLQGGSGGDIYEVSGTVLSSPSLVLIGQAGEYISAGKSSRFDADTGSCSVDSLMDLSHDGLVDQLTLHYWEPSSGDYLYLNFRTDTIGQNIEVGTYVDAERASSASAGHPGLDVYGNGRGSNMVYGRFTIHDIAIDYSSGNVQLVRFSADFEQHSETPDAPALFGSIRYGEPDELVSTAITELPGEGIDEVRSSVSYALSENVENLTLTGNAETRASGNAEDNRIVGNGANNTLSGGAGNDTLDGGAGTDTVLYTGNRSGYSITLSNGSYTVTDTNIGDGDDGTDALTGIELIAFDDVSMLLGSNNGPTGSLGIDGSATQGLTLTASDTLTDLDGLGAVSYQWQGSSDGSTWNNLGTGASLLLTQAQVGQQIRLVASYTDGFGTQESITSSAMAIVANINDGPSGSVTISGSTMQGQTLTASNDLADADGLGTISYQWNADGIAIAGATEGSFTLGEAQVDETITVTASYTDGHGTTESVTSGAVIANMALSAKYFITDPRGSYIDWSARIQSASLLGKGVQVVGGAGDDTVFVQAGASAYVTNLGVGVNMLYLTGSLTDYTQTISQETGVYTLTRIAGLLEGQTERVKFTVGDKSDRVYFADGHITINADTDSRLYDGASFKPIEAEWLTPGATPAAPVTTEATTATHPAKVFIVDAQGLDVPMLMQPGQSMTVTGSGAVDTIYINAGTSVDATNLGGGADRLYLLGNLSDYSQTIGQETGVYTLSRIANGQNEVVQFTVSDQDDVVYFADGHITVNASADSRFFAVNPVASEFQPIQSDWLTPDGATLAVLLNLGVGSMTATDFIQPNI